MKHSWVVTDKHGNAILETWEIKTVNAVNLNKYTVQTAYDYLCELNETIKNRKGQ